ncbi:hypothetical protein CP533_4748, partial [Ophiocordyceps camponoti-saundersi (nom. inval.)]
MAMVTKRAGKGHEPTSRGKCHDSSVLWMARGKGKKRGGEGKGGPREKAGQLSRFGSGIVHQRVQEPMKLALEEKERETSRKGPPEKGHGADWLRTSHANESCLHPKVPKGPFQSGKVSRDT